MKEKDEELKALLAESRAIRAEAEEYLRLKGVDYKLSEWITLKAYAKRFRLESTNVVSNWISRGIVPAENVITIEAYNNLKLIKAVSYRTHVIEDALKEDKE